MTPPHRKFKKNAPHWYEEIHECQRKAHSSRRIRVEHGTGLINPALVLTTAMEGPLICGTASILSPPS
ncbi:MULTISPECIES: hypothetical protein [Streptomyces]|uniref:hypothetical protein n=1 Tax=Streptomyces TaxID=1883 RepID=UPI001E50B01D|nr:MULTISPECIES: hypothetical protein [Streptomyces]MCZ4101731.1 hypothetical protein [Streptomyces sp. H39-C1]